MALARDLFVCAGLLFFVRTIVVVGLNRSTAELNFLSVMDFLFVGVLLLAIMCAGWAWLRTPLIAMLEKRRLRRGSAPYAAGDGRKMLALCIIIVALLGAWMFRYEYIGFGMHKNRLTGATCHFSQSCWFE